MWIEIASCLGDVEREAFMDALLIRRSSSEKRHNFAMKRAELLLKREGIALVATAGLTEFECEARLNIHTTATHRILKSAIFENVQSRISLEEWGDEAAKILTPRKALLLSELNDRLTFQDTIVPLDPQSTIDLYELEDGDANLAEAELRELKDIIRDSMPRINPPITARSLAIQTSTNELFVFNMLRSQIMAPWLATPIIRVDMLYEEALLRGMQRLRNEILEAPIWEGWERNKFNAKNAGLVMAAVRFLDERMRDSTNRHLHIHQHERGPGALAPKTAGAPEIIGRGQSSLQQSAGNAQLPSADAIGNMSLQALLKLEAEIDSGEK